MTQIPNSKTDAGGEALSDEDVSELLASGTVTESVVDDQNIAQDQELLAVEPQGEEENVAVGPERGVDAK